MGDVCRPPHAARPAFRTDAGAGIQPSESLQSSLKPPRFDAKRKYSAEGPWITLEPAATSRLTCCTHHGESCMPDPLVLAITGASGAVYAVRLLEMLVQSGRDVHLTVSQSAREVLKQELNVHVDLDNFEISALVDLTDKPGRVLYHHYQDFRSPVASGSYLTGGMVICPCSGGTLSALAYGTAENLIHRAAEVHLKEHRKLIVVPRETPLSRVQIDNMKRVAEAGAVILPAAPGWYHGVNSVLDLVDFIVARILDQLRVEHALVKRWSQDRSSVSY